MDSLSPDPGPWRIIVTITGDEWCDECYNDAKDPTDRDCDTMAVSKRILDGVCVCCGGKVVAGEMFDSDGHVR